VDFSFVSHFSFSSLFFFESLSSDNTLNPEEAGKKSLVALAKI